MYGKKGRKDAGFRQGSADMTALSAGYHLQYFSPDFPGLGV
jgi:hypothetical protein